MPERKNIQKQVDPLIAELERLRAASSSAMTTFRSIEERLAKLEKEIQKTRGSACSGQDSPGNGTR